MGFHFISYINIVIHKVNLIHMQVIYRVNWKLIIKEKVIWLIILVIILSVVIDSLTRCKFTLKLNGMEYQWKKYRP